MAVNRLPTSTTPQRDAWGLWLWVALAVLAPTACLLWFMTEAVRNEQWAVRQRLTEVYRGELERAAEAWQKEWGARIDRLSIAIPGESPAEQFGRLALVDECEGALIYDADGRLLYPNLSPPVAGIDDASTVALALAEALRSEREDDDSTRTAELYAAIANDAATSPSLAARALLGRARVLHRLGRTPEALAILTLQLGEVRFIEARDAQGRLIVPNAQILALTWMADQTSQLFLRTSAMLRFRVENYGKPTLPFEQRLFLLDELWASAPDQPRLKWVREAARLEAQYLETDGDAPSVLEQLTPSPLKGVFQFERLIGDGPFNPTVSSMTDWRLVLLFRRERLEKEFAEAISSATQAAGFRLTLLSPAQGPSSDAFLTNALEGPLAGWSIALHLEGPDPFAAAARQRVALYGWTGLLMISLIALLMVWVGRSFGRQMKLARLKSDFIATVTHELKTPLASMRLLVDTLIEGNVVDARQSRVYLELIARENSRLSHLIDNFLSFSRMERNKRAFEFAPLKPAEIIEGAVAAVRERLEAAGFTLEVDVAEDLPPVHGDRDALTTVLLNLLDNACKYSAERKQIALRARAAGGEVRFEVEDQGIGIPRRAQKRIFERFYQVDQSLSRATGGCGLGLSIVQFIVAAHGGRVEVTSQPGRGSTFTVSLPANGG